LVATAAAAGALVPAEDASEFVCPIVARL